MRSNLHQIENLGAIEQAREAHIVFGLVDAGAPVVAVLVGHRLWRVATGGNLKGAQSNPLPG